MSTRRFVYLLIAQITLVSIASIAGSNGTTDAILKEKLQADYKLLQQAASANSADEQKTLLMKARAAKLGEAHAVTNKEFQTILSLQNKKVSQNDVPEVEIHAAINPTDSLNMVCSGMTSTGLGLDFPIYVTKDGGTTWSQSAFAPGPASEASFVLGGGDPMFAFDATGKLYYSWIDLYFDLGSTQPPMEMYWAYSNDGGLNFTREPQGDTISSGFLNLTDQDHSSMPDKQWMVCDQSSSTGRNNLYCSLLQYYFTDQRVAMRMKSASEATFKSTVLRPTATDYHFNQFTSIDCDAQGRVHMSFVGAFASDSMPEGEFRIFHIMSDDHGASLKKENLVSPIRFLKSSHGSPTVLTPPTGMSRIQCLPTLACDKSSSSQYHDNVYLAWTALGTTSDAHNGLDVYFSRSTDHGETWSTPTVVNDDARGTNATQAYVSMTVNADGVIVLCWYDFRDDPAAEKANYYMCYSFDGGKTFEKNFAVSTAQSDFSLFVGDTLKSFGMGEYNQVVATRGFAYPFWGDVRTGERQIFMAKVPIARGVVDVEEESLSAIAEGLTMQRLEPNPAGSSSTLRFQCSHDTELSIEIIDEHASLVHAIDASVYTAGPHSLTFNTAAIASGQYYVRLKSPRAVLVQPLILVH